eukprot:jgi/Chrzof1/9109/Cz03g36100.t1
MAGVSRVWQDAPHEVLRLVFDACPNDRGAIELVCKPWATVAQQMPCTKQLHLEAPIGQQQVRAAMKWLLRHGKAVMQHVTTTSIWVVRSLAVCEVERLHLTWSERDGIRCDLDHPNLQSLQLTVSGIVDFEWGSLPGLRSLALDLEDWTCPDDWPTTLPESLQHLDGLQSLEIKRLWSIAGMGS